MAIPTHNVEKTFGLVIAFLFPGMVALFALSLHIKTLQQWLWVSGGPGGGALVLLLLLAIGLGVLVSGVRSELIDGRWRPGGRPRMDWRIRRDENQEIVYQNLLVHHYRYAQFHGNTVVSSSGLLTSWLLLRWSEAPPGEAALLSVLLPLAPWAATIWVCWRAGKHNLLRYDERRQELLPIRSDGSVIDRGTPPPAPPALGSEASTPLISPSPAPTPSPRGDSTLLTPAGAR